MFYSKVYRFHQTVTGRRAVAGVHVNVLTPKAFWAVIGVAVSLDGSPAMRADEIFNVSLKFLVHRLIPAFSASRFTVRFRLGETEAARSKSQ